MISRTAKLALTLIGGAAAVTAFMQSRRVQSEKKPAYVVAEVEITDPVAFQVYLNKAIETLKPYNVRVISNSKPDVKEGTPAQGCTALGFWDTGLKPTLPEHAVEGAAGDIQPG